MAAARLDKWSCLYAEWKFTSQITDSLFTLTEHLERFPVMKTRLPFHRAGGYRGNDQSPHSNGTQFESWPNTGYPNLGNSCFSPSLQENPGYNFFRNIPMHGPSIQERKECTTVSKASLQLQASRSTAVSFQGREHIHQCLYQTVHVNGLSCSAPGWWPMLFQGGQVLYIINPEFLPEQKLNIQNWRHDSENLSPFPKYKCV